MALGGPLARRLAALPDDAVRAAREEACAIVGRYAGEGGLVIPGMTLVAHARRK